MPCYRPIKGYRSRVVNPETGRRSIVFKPAEGLVDMPVDLPCGQCIGCRLERSRQWAIRCVHEASLYERNCFVTLTLNDEHLPEDRGLDVKTFQDFMKRLRKRFGEGIRFFHCGEYGSRYGRPHYHALLFNFDFADKYHWRWNENGDRIWRSRALDGCEMGGKVCVDDHALWPWGYCEVGSVTFESAAYVARYITKKITGPDAEDYYRGRKAEYTTMSRRPGIGKEWYEKFKGDVFPSDQVVLRGREMRPPGYYSRLYEVDSPLNFAKVKRSRKRKAISLARVEPETRLAVREKLHLLRFQLLERGYENEDDVHCSR